LKVFQDTIEGVEKSAAAQHLKNKNNNPKLSKLRTSLFIHQNLEQAAFKTI